MSEARMEITAGAGGPEAQAWAAMVLRMYLRWASRRGYSVAPGREVRRTEAGIERATIELSGTGVERSHAEHGVHRLVRFSPFDPEKRRHTSFASVYVTPIVEGSVVEPAHWHRGGLWGGQIRSYVLDPYKKVKDLRTGIERNDVDTVLDGDIDDFLDGAVAAGLPHKFDPNGPESAAVME